MTFGDDTWTFIPVQFWFLWFIPTWIESELNASSERKIYFQKYVLHSDTAAGFTVSMAPWGIPVFKNPQCVASPPFLAFCHEMKEGLTGLVRTCAVRAYALTWRSTIVFIVKRDTFSRFQTKRKRERWLRFFIIQPKPNANESHLLSENANPGGKKEEKRAKGSTRDSHVVTASPDRVVEIRFWQIHLWQSDQLLPSTRRTGDTLLQVWDVQDNHTKHTTSRKATELKNEQIWKLNTHKKKKEQETNSSKLCYLFRKTARRQNCQ